MRTIHFKNGTSIEVPQGVVESLAGKSISPVEPNDLQWFKVDSDVYNLVIRFSEISHID